MKSRRWGIYALAGLIFHCLVCVILVLLGLNGFKIDTPFYILGALDMPGMAILVLHTIWIFISVLSKEYPGSRFPKLAAIFLAGPLATIYIGIKYVKL